MTQTASTSSPAPTRLFPLGWTTILSLVAAITAAGAGTLHIIGLTQHQVYLDFWGINANLFPKATDWLLLHGYYGMLDRFVAVFRAYMGNVAWTFAAAVFFCLLVFLGTLVSCLEPPKPSSWFVQRASLLRRIFLMLLVTLGLCAAIPGALMVFVGFSAVPAAIGETVGRSFAEAALIDFKLGCAESKRQCVQLKRGAENIAKGYVLDDAQSHIAIFDVDLQRGRMLPREGLEVVAVREPGLKTNGK